MPIGDIFEHKDQQGKFVVQVGPSPEDYRVAGNLAEARAIKQALQVQRQFTETREQVQQVGQQPEVQQALQVQGSEAQGALGRAAIGMAPALAAGAATGGIGGIAGILTRMGAQGVAELGRQKIQGEETSLPEAGMAAGLTGGVDVVSKAGKAIFQGLMQKSPGVMHRISENELAKTRQMVIGANLTVDKQGVAAAYDAFGNILKQQGAASVNLANTGPVFKDVVDEMLRRPALLKQPAILNKFKKLSKQTNQGTLPFDEVGDLLKDVNAAIGSTTNANERRLLIKAKNSIFQDIDSANVPVEQRQALREATKLAKEAFAKGDLNDAIEAGIRRSNVTGAQIINPKTILDNLDELKKDALFTSSFKKGELDKVESFFREITKKLRGTSAEGTAIILGGLGGASGSAAAMAMGSAQPGLGTALGAAAGVSAPSLFTKIALSDKLASSVIRMVGEGKPINSTVLNLLANLAKPSTIAPAARGATQ